MPFISFQHVKATRNNSNKREIKHKNPNEFLHILFGTENQKRTKRDSLLTDLISEHDQRNYFFSLPILMHFNTSTQDDDDDDPVITLGVLLWFFQFLSFANG